MHMNWTSQWKEKYCQTYILINLSYMLKHKDTQTLKVENRQKI